MLIELSHVIRDGMITYPGIPAPVIGSHLTFEESAAHYAQGTEFSIGSMTLAANTGTYLDTPAHRFRNGHDLTGLTLDGCADLAAILIRCREIAGRSIAPSMLPDTSLEGCAVLFDTGWSSRWSTESYASGEHPYLAEATAETLVAAGVTLVGIDSLNVDAADDGTRPVHTMLLGAGVVIVEHLTGLDRVPDTGARFFATPPLIDGMATFPVRAFAIA